MRSSQNFYVRFDRNPFSSHLSDASQILLLEYFLVISRPCFAKYRVFRDIHISDFFCDGDSLRQFFNWGLFRSRGKFLARNFTRRSLTPHLHSGANAHVSFSPHFRITSRKFREVTPSFYIFSTFHFIYVNVEKNRKYFLRQTKSLNKRRIGETEIRNIPKRSLFRAPNA